MNEPDYIEYEKSIIETDTVQKALEKAFGIKIPAGTIDMYQYIADTKGITRWDVKERAFAIVYGRKGRLI
jgi:hypothetical protein